MALVKPQVYRSSVTGNVPAAGTRQPGELWANFPDLQLGVIDASRNAQRLVAVRYFSTAANYAVGDFVIQSGVLYVANTAVTAGAFSFTQWTKIATTADIPAAYVLPTASMSVLGGVKIDGSSITIASGTISATQPAPYILPPASTTILGGVKVDGTTITATGAGVITAASSPVQPMNDNRIINGDMRIDQRNNGAAGSATGYTVDQWRYDGSQASKLTWQRLPAGPSTQSIGFANYLAFTSSSAYAPLAADTFIFTQIVEADMVSDFAWGTPNARPVTLSFWVNSSLAGTFGGSFRNAPSPATRSYPFSFSIPVTGVWTKTTITIPGDTAGTWVMNGNLEALRLSFDLGCGANSRASAGAWTAGPYLGATGSVSVVATNGATFYVTGVKLEIGNVATPFNRQSLAKSMADCQRYYQTAYASLYGYSNASNNFGYFVRFTGDMRADPTIAVTGISALQIRPNGFLAIVVPGSTGNTTFNVGYTASAEL